MPTPLLQATVICDVVLRPADAEFPVSLHGVHQTLLATSFPAQTLPFWVANVWVRDVEPLPGEETLQYQEEVQIVQPPEDGEDASETVLATATGKFTLGRQGIHVSLYRVDNVVFPAPGKYVVRTLLNGDLARDVPLDVIEEPVPATNATGGRT